MEGPIQHGLRRVYEKLEFSINAGNYYEAHQIYRTLYFRVFQTLFDGKCVNTIVGNNASSRCPMCLQTVHEFGNFNDNFTVKESSLELGLGLLHAEIKIMEHLLHIAYRSTAEAWDIRKDLKEEFGRRKLIIQKRVYKKVGVRVDQVLQGHGTTNTGNTARKCFANSTAFADALKIDSQFVFNLSVIILALKSKKHIKLEKLEKFYHYTYCLYYKLFPWVRMSPTVHKLLRHGCEIARKFPIPIAYYAEDANEAWHKLYRKNMQSHARQNSRENRILDVFNGAVYLLDPKISLILMEKRLKNAVRNELSHHLQKFITDRYLGLKKYSDLIELLYNGSLLFLQREQHNSGADLGILLIDVLKKSNTPPSSDYFEKVVNLFALMNPVYPEREVFIQNAVCWSMSGINFKTGHPNLHERLAKVYWHEKNYTEARHHFLYTKDGSGCASMLVELHERQGLMDEIDLFITQIVLQYLCLQNKPTAFEAFKFYIGMHPKINGGPPFHSPLLNFSFFLLKTVESGKQSTFRFLCEQYLTSLSKDPSLTHYLDKIGQLFFNIRPSQNCNRGILNSFLHSFFNVLDEEDTNEHQRITTSKSHLTAELD